MLWEWRLTGLSDIAELLISELVTNAVQISRADGQTTPVRLWVLADRTRVLILVWDSSPLPPVRMSTSEDDENGRGLLLVETLSTRWDWYFPPQQNGGKVVWALLETLVMVTTEPPPGLSWRRFARCRYSRRPAMLSKPSLRGIMHAATSAAGHAIGNKFKITTRARLSTWRGTPMRVGRT